MANLSMQQKLSLLEQVGEEIVTKEDLVALLESGQPLIAYDGFEPSGTIHIAQGLVRSININKMTKAGITFHMFVADWHAWANNKMGGDLEKIKVIGHYFIEVWKACGMDMTNVKFLWASDFAKDDNYWKLVMQIARNNTVKRILRCSQIMGRSESDDLSAAQILYPCMQCADIFYMKANICQLGMDQRKVNMLAREIASKLGYAKPVAIHHHMLCGLLEPAKESGDAVEKAIAAKMSKSNPMSAIFMTDAADVVEKKLAKAYCPEGVILGNPLMEYCKYIIFEKFDSITIERPAKYGGNLTFVSYNDLADSFEKKNVHPADLKKTVAVYINKLLDPVRKHFETDAHAKKLLAQVQSFSVTR